MLPRPVLPDVLRALSGMRMAQRIGGGSAMSDHPCVCGHAAGSHTVDIFGTPLALPRDPSLLAVPCLECEACEDYQEESHAGLTR